MGRVPGGRPSPGDGGGASPVLPLPWGLQSGGDPPAPSSTGTNKGWAPPARPLQLNQPAAPLPTRRLPAPGTRGAQRSAAQPLSAQLRPSLAQIDASYYDGYFSDAIDVNSTSPTQTKPAS